MRSTSARKCWQYSPDATTQQDNTVTRLQSNAADRRTVVDARVLGPVDLHVASLERDGHRVAAVVASWADQRDAILEIAPVHAILIGNCLGRRDRSAEVDAEFVEPYRVAVVTARLVGVGEVTIIHHCRRQAVTQRCEIEAVEWP
jgi:hypothetical protein